MSGKRAAGVLAVVLLAIGLVDYAMSALVTWVGFAEAILKTDLSSLQQKQLDIYIQVTQQLLTLATLVLGAVGFFAAERTLVQRDRQTLSVVAILAAVSIFAGYLSLNKTLWMLDENFFNLTTPILYYVRFLQFGAFVASAGVFAWLWLTHKQDALTGGAPP